MLLLIFGWCGGNKHNLIYLALKLREIERTVVKSRRKAEPKVDKRLLSGTVSRIHAPDLRQGYMRLIDNNQELLRKIVNQRTGRLPGQGTGQMAGIVFNSGTESRLPHHLHIKISSL